MPIHECGCGGEGCCKPGTSAGRLDPQPDEGIMLTVQNSCPSSGPAVHTQLFPGRSGGKRKSHMEVWWCAGDERAHDEANQQRRTWTPSPVTSPIIVNRPTDTPRPPAFSSVSTPSFGVDVCACKPIVSHLHAVYQQMRRGGGPHVHEWWVINLGAMATGKAQQNDSSHHDPRPIACTLP